MPEKKEEVETPTVETNGTENGSEEQVTNGDQAETKAKDDGKTEGKEEVKEDPPKEMRAVVLTGFGGYKGLKILKKPEPVVQAGEVLIRVKAWYVIRTL